MSHNIHIEQTPTEEIKCARKFYVSSLFSENTKITDRHYKWKFGRWCRIF